jgi:hypothetical protein
MLRKAIILLAVGIFALTCTLTVFAAEKQWCVIKDKNGVCKVIQCKDKTPDTIAGPFPTKDAAKKAKEKECPKPEKPAKSEKKEPAKKQP